MTNQFVLRFDVFVMLNIIILGKQFVLYLSKKNSKELRMGINHRDKTQTITIKKIDHF